jgi:hypothetical protein
MIVEEVLTKFRIQYPTAASILYIIILIPHLLIPGIILLFLFFSNNILILMGIIMFELILVLHWHVHKECCIIPIERALSSNQTTVETVGQSIVGKPVLDVLHIILRPIITFMALYRIYYLKCTG